MSINLSALMKQRYDTAANWTAQNPTLLAGEIGIESDTKKWKVGTGSTAWTSLTYAIGGTYPIVNADIAAGAEIAVSKLADGSARQLLQTDAAGTGVEWTSDVSIPGVLSVTAGTAALPGIAVSGDPNTGIYSPGADQLAISTGGTVKATVDSSGRVLVGTSSNDSNAIAVIQGIAGNAATSGVLALRYGSTRPGAETLIGSIRFESTSNTTSSYHYAQISAISDGVSSSDTDIPGRLEFSTTADGSSTGTPTVRMRIASDGAFSSVIPGGSTLYPQFGCRAWVNFNGTGTVAIRGSGNVSSITDNGTGDYTVNFTTALADANYAAIATVGSSVNFPFKTTATPVTTSTVSVLLIQPGVNYYDDANIHVAIFR